MQSYNYFYDENQTKYQLVKSNPGHNTNDWLFFPGGPGIDSNYLLDLVQEMDVAGNYWLIDLPHQDEFSPDTIYNYWGAYFLTAIKKFTHPVIVGHSFGGTFPLYFPQLEHILKGLIIVNSAPILPADVCMQVAKENKLPSFKKFMAAFIDNPNNTTIKTLYHSALPYFFTTRNFEQGTQLINKLSFAVNTEHWWFTKGAQTYANIEWIPKKVPVLIIGGSHDFMTPKRIFEQDARFQRQNIKIITIANAGHFSWVEQPALVKEAISSFATIALKE